MREVVEHPWFRAVKWDQIHEKKAKAPFVPADLLRIKYVKEQQAAGKTVPKGADLARELYLVDTRFFSQKYTNVPTTKLQEQLDEMTSGKALPFVSDDCWLDIKKDLNDAGRIRSALSECDDAQSYNSTCDTSILSSNASECMSVHLNC